MIPRAVLMTAFLAIAPAAAAAQPEVAPPEGPAVQQPTPPPPKPRVVAPVPTPPAQPAPTPMPKPELPFEAARKIRGRDVNVQVEITISDQIGTTAPEKKVVSLLAADQTTGRVRANANASRANVGMVGTLLNVDARPIVLDNDRILLELTVVYTPLRETSVTQSPTNLEESMHVILQNGKPLTISQAADPISDRRMTVEVKATILK